VTRWRHAGAAALVVALAVANTWPLAARLSTAIPGAGPGDNVTGVWNLWWARRALADPAAAFFHTDALLWPYGANLALNTHTALNGLAAATLLSRLDLITAQNVLVLASIVLTALCAYGLAFEITRQSGASLVAAAIFGGAPYFAAHLNGHFNLMSGWVLPLWLLFVRRALLRHRLRDAAAAGGVLGAAAYCDDYYLVFCLVAGACLWLVHRSGLRFTTRPRPVAAGTTAAHAGLLALIVAIALWIHATGGTTLHVGPVVVIMRETFNLRIAFWVVVAAWLLMRIRPRVSIGRVEGDLVRADLRCAAVALAVSAVAALPLVPSVVSLVTSGGYVSPPTFFRSAPRGIDLVAFVSGNPAHPWYGGIVSRLDARLHVDPIEGVGWLGIAPILLAVAGWRTGTDGVERRAWGWLLIVFFVWALGSFLSVAGWNTGLVLPAALLRHVPIVSNVRMPGRAIVMVYLAIAMLSALAVAAMPARRRRSMVPLFLVLVAADYASAPIPVWRVEIPAVYRALAERRDGGPLLEVPVGVRDGFGTHGAPDPGAVLYQTVHEHPIVGGFVARIPPRVIDGYLADPAIGPLLRESEGSAPGAPPLSGASLRDALHARGIRYVVLRRSAASPLLARQIDDALGASKLLEADGRALFVVPER